MSMGDRPVHHLELQEAEVPPLYVGDDTFPVGPPEAFPAPLDFHEPGKLVSTLRYNKNKPQLSYILEFDHALDMIADVMTKGAVKYARNNWKLGGDNTELSSLLDSAMRHLKARQNGEDYDPDFGSDHLAMAACNILFALWHHGEWPREV